MNKKAISPLIATVLMIGFTIALAFVVMYFGGGFVIPDVEEPKEKFYHCWANTYDIEYVDEIIQDNCYVIKNEKMYDMIVKDIKESFELIDADLVYYYNVEKGWESCSTIEAAGKLYCLRDNSTCLKIENNKICKIFNLTG